MVDFNAAVTVDSDGRLTLGSMAIVERDGTTVASSAVPLLAPVGGVLFWHRVDTSLLEVGWRVARNAVDRHVRDGNVVRFNAQPVT